MKYLVPLLLIAMLIVGCKSEEQRKREAFVADSTKQADSLALLIKPRAEIYSAATAQIKNVLKVPSTARFAAVQVENTDSSAIELIGKDTATVTGKYDAQNPMGVFLGGKFRVDLVRRNGKWETKSPKEYNFLDIKADYSGEIGHALTAAPPSTTPPPPPPALPN